jgi:hypothetical protein
MKPLSLVQAVILILAAFAAGFAGKSVLDITFKKFRNAEFVAEAEGLLGVLRQKTSAFRTQKGRFPRDPAEMQAVGFWTVNEPPRERLGAGGSRWVASFDGEGGFVYLSSTGQIYLNSDLSREKFFRADRQKVAALVPPGALY